MKIELDKNPILEKELLDDKIGILDIKAKGDNDTNINIEMQVVDKKNIEKRLLFYWSKMYIQGIKESDDYEKLEKSLIILFTDYELEKLKNIKKYVTQWNIREKHHTQIVLTNVLEIYIIEMKKYKENKKKTELDLWLKFLENPGVMKMGESKSVDKAKKVLEEISQDERERYLAELRQKYIMDQKAIADAGYDKGVNQGRKEGLEQGKQQEKLEIAKKLKEMKLSIEDIIKATGLSKEEIEKL